MVDDQRIRLQPWQAGLTGLVLLLWLFYTVLQTMAVLGKLAEPVYAFLGFLPGILGAGVLLAGGFTPDECYLRRGRLSSAGLAVLAGVFVFALAAILPFGVWQGWDWIAALVYAPATGVAQELFFRAVLLPLFLLIFSGRPILGLASHAALFGLWHIGPVFLGTSLAAVAAIMVVPFISGLGWGWQVKHDRTVFWAMAQHSLIWAIGNQFAYNA